MQNCLTEILYGCEIIFVTTVFCIVNNQQKILVLVHLLMNIKTCPDKQDSICNDKLWPVTICLFKFVFKAMV